MQEDETREKDMTPMPCKGKCHEVETSMPLALKEILSLDLGSTVAKFVPASEFCNTNLPFLKNLKEIELMVLIYVMCKETMDPRYGFNGTFISNFNFFVVILILCYVIYREVLCTYATLLFMDRRDVLSMHNNGEIASNIIDCWALYLIAVEHI